METNRLPRAILLAAAVAAGSAGSLPAQTEPVAADPSTVIITWPVGTSMPEERAPEMVAVPAP